MSAINDYKTRMSRYGDMRTRTINDARYTLSSNFTSSPSYFEVMINSATPTIGVWIVSGAGSDLNKKKVIMQPSNEINIGDLILVNSHKWLCTSVDKYNPINESGVIEFCNATLTITTYTTTYSGYDNLGRPIPVKTPTLSTVDCIVQSKTRLQTESDKPVNIPDGRILVSIQYDSSLNIDNKSEFKLHNATWRIVEMDYTNVINDVGILSFMAERDV